MEENTIFRPEEVEGKTKFTLEEHNYLKPAEVEGKTKFTPEEVIEIAKRKIKELKDDYDLKESSLAYKKCLYETKEPAWFVSILPKKITGHFSDPYEDLIISDVTGEAIYIMNDHGRLFEI